MRIAVHHETEVAVRASQILLAERELVSLGLVDRSPTHRDDERVDRADDLSGFDVVITDAEDASAVVDRALDAGISVVTWRSGVDEDHADAFRDADRTVLMGANLAEGIAPCLGAHESARSGEPMDVTIAWTEPGRPLRRGEPLPFPDPVGARWGAARPTAVGRAFAAPIAGTWAGAMARVTSAHSDGVVTRIVGVADLAPHLEALALAAGAIVVASGPVPPGAVTPVAVADDYLAAALRAGLDVAAYTIDGVTNR